MHLLLVAILIICSFALGYRGGINDDAELREQQVLAELAESQNKTPAKSLAYAISVISDQKIRSQKEETLHPSTVELALDQVPLSPHESDLLHALGNSPDTARLRRLLIARNHASELPGTELFIKNANEDLLKDKSGSIDELEDSLKRIPSSGFPLERIALLNMLDQIGGQNNTIKEECLNELTTNIIPSRPNPQLAQTQEELNTALSTTPDMALPLTAHLIYLKNTSDPTEAMSGTVQGIVAQPDRGVQIALAAQFVQAYPDMKGQLISTLVNQGIQLHLESLK